MEIKKTNGEKEIVYYKAIKKTTAVGSGCHVVLPLKLLGKEVEVVFKEVKAK